MNSAHLSLLIVIIPLLWSVDVGLGFKVIDKCYPVTASGFYVGNSGTIVHLTSFGSVVGRTALQAARRHTRPLLAAAFEVDLQLYLAKFSNNFSLLLVESSC